MIDNLISNNLDWASGRVRADPQYFQHLAAQQHPEYLWLGCSDSHVPANEIVGLDPGELFVHRNVSNIACPQDANFLSVLQFALEKLKIKHIIVCGHYGCGGVKTAMDGNRHGLIDHWLRPISDIAARRSKTLHDIKDVDSRVNMICEENVRAQVLSVAQNPFVKDAWRRKQSVAVHGLIYSIRDGLLRSLDMSITKPSQAEKLRQILKNLDE
ncbi:carbonic anhydrase [Robiginitomaculum antarcticum]|uniref:carbonic anhydrase n=1 Tax=Robiginitomaculum antarcticum TaxID=437507 RepID=UPI000368F075|nr:carbonic anhydrase [Robiginitomaculum antarcticum]